MKQQTLTGFEKFGKTTRRAQFLAEMEQKWGAFVADPGFGSALAAREANGPLYRSIRRRIVDGGQFDHLIGDATSD